MGSCESTRQSVSEPITSPTRGRGGAAPLAAWLWLILPPVLQRELRVALHQGEAKKARSRVARYGVIGVSLFMLLGAAMGTANWGATLHFFLFLAGLSLAAWPALQMSVGLFAEERRQQELELLYLTGMGSAELFIGKLLGGVLVSSGELLALAPLVAVPFLSGGVSFDLFLATATCLPSVFFAVLAMGSLSSALCKNESTAGVVSGLVLGVSCLALPVPYNLGFWLTGNVPFDKAWLTLSPALGPWMVAKNFGGFRVADFWVWAALTWGLSFACLGLAAMVLKWNWLRELRGPVRQGWRLKWEDFVVGDRTWREHLRRWGLEKNAYQWLVQRDRRPVLQAWGFIASVCALWLVAWAAWPRVWLSPLILYATAAVLLYGLGVLVSYAAARRIAADRRDGSLELLLTTPLTPQDMLAGEVAALQQQFQPVKRGLLGLLSVMVVAGLLGHHWTRQAFISYLLVWCLFFAGVWGVARRSAPLAMWVALNCGRPLYGGFRTGTSGNRSWAFYWVFFMSSSLGSLAGRVRSFPNGSTGEMVVVMAGVLWIFLARLANRNFYKPVAVSLVSQMRLIAQEPLPGRNDPRFKQWKDLRTRFPAGPGGWLGVPGEEPAAKPVKAAGTWLWRPVGRICGLAWGNLRKAARRR